jgi:hypothetical protein
MDRRGRQATGMRDGYLRGAFSRSATPAQTSPSAPVHTVNHRPGAKDLA